MKRHIIILASLLAFAISAWGQIAGAIGPNTIFVEKGQKCQAIQSLMPPSSDYAYYLNWEYSYLDGPDNWTRLPSLVAGGLSYDPGYPTRSVKYRRIMTCYLAGNAEYRTDPVYIYIKEDGMFAGHIRDSQELTLGQTPSRLWLWENPVNCNTYRWEYAYSTDGPWYQSYYGDYDQFPYTPPIPFETVYFRLAGTRTSPNKTVYSNIVCLSMNNSANWIEGQQTVNKYNYASTFEGLPLGQCTPDFQYWWEVSSSGAYWSMIGDSFGCESYTPSTRMEQTTYYRRVIGSPSWQHTSASNVICVTVLPVYKNFIKTSTTTAYGYSDPSKTLTTIQTFDSFGRLEETINWGITPSGNDLVTLQEYDALGRPAAAWLPAATKVGIYMDPVAVKTKSQQTNLGDTSPYAAPVYEASPSGRVVSQTSPGAQWQNKAVTAEYRLNTGYMSPAGEPPMYDQHLACARFDVVGTTGVKRVGMYPANTLYVTQATDEDGNVSLEFTDKLGQVVLSRQRMDNNDYDSATFADTYYVYDMKGNLCYVLPPAAADLLTANGTTWNDDNDTLKKYAYIYKYDSRNRCIEKKLPGAEKILYVYDKANNLIFTQDGVQRQSGQWSFSVPDCVGRPAVSGTCGITIPGSSAWAGDTIAPGNFDDRLFVTERYQGYDSYRVLIDGTNIGVALGTQLTINYYDDYDFLGYVVNAGLPDYSTSYTTTAGGGYGARYEPGNYRGLLTGTLVKSLSDTGMYDYSAFYYDYRKRPVQSHEFQGIAGDYITQCYQYDFVGNVLKKLEKHDFMGTRTDKLESTYTYDHASRLLSETTVLNGSTANQARVTYAYNELGQLASKTYGTGAGAFTETFDYNVRGWLTGQSSPHFEMALRYNDPLRPEIAASWTGNITEWDWKHKGTGADNTLNTYGFTYDKLNRLADTDHYLGAETTPSNSFVERGLKYDKMGNIEELKRYSGGYLVDDLTYAYDGNQLASLKENIASPQSGWDLYERGANATAAYEYDPNGNMTYDERKGLNFNYNLLNLLSEARDSASGDLVAKYTYLADGQKVRAVNGAGTFGLEYLGSLVYKRNGNSLELESAAFGEGRIYKASNDYEVNYFLADHLGSTRVVAKPGSSGIEIAERNNFYPFGAKHPDPTWTNPTSAVNRYRFSGKEDQESLGLKFVDFGWRMDDPLLGRWFGIDRLAEKYYPISPYAFCANNPIKFIDTNGKWIVGTDGKPVSYSQETGWSENASSDVQRVGNAMMKVETGMERLNFMLNHDEEISITISPEVNLSMYGIDNRIITTTTYSDGTQTETVKHEITIFEGTLDYFEGRGDYAGMDREDAIGAVAGHESGHVEKENTQMAIDGKPTKEIEKRPNEIEDQMKEEYKKLRENENN